MSGKQRRLPGTGIAVDLELPPALGRLRPELETALFRIVQESLTNIHRHSGSTTANIGILLTPDDVKLEVKDQGRGIHPKTVRAALEDRVELGVGIAGMRERARQLHGCLEIRSDGHGTTVTAVLPLVGRDS